MPEKEPIIIKVETYDALLWELYELAVKYPTIEGTAASDGDGATMWARVESGTENQRFQFQHSSGDGRILRTFVRQLGDLGFLNGMFIQFHRIKERVEQVQAVREERQRQEEEKRRKEAEEDRRWRVKKRWMILGPLISGVGATAIGFFLSFLSYSAKIERLDEKVSGLRSDVSALQKLVGPASQPASRP